jgi:hypothetical protein
MIISQSKKFMNKRNVVQSIKVIILGLVLCLGVSYASAFTPAVASLPMHLKTKINGVCNNPGISCSAGLFSNLSETPIDECGTPYILFHWMCNGENGGTSTACSTTVLQ